MSNDLTRGASSTPARQQATAKRIALAVFAFLAFSLFVSLGTWQVKRLFWKRDLIARVEQRVHAEPVAAPTRAYWPQITAASDEYRHVKVSGNYLYGLTTKVQASTVLGSGYWLLTPLRTEDGSIVIVNRGFVPSQQTSGTEAASSQSVKLDVTGLLRINEPGGSLLRHNDAANNRWYSRDVDAIAKARGLSDVAPYFIDTDAYPEKNAAGPEQPVGGLTVIAFPNNHLVYAITWFALALLLALALWRIARSGVR
jgi:surfeit locus 1 family protein